MTVCHIREKIDSMTGQEFMNPKSMIALRFKDNPFFPGGNVPMTGYGPNCNVDDGTLGSYGGCITDTMNYPDGFDRQFIIQRG